MGPPKKPFVYCEGSPKWDPESYVADTELHSRAADLLSQHDDLATAIIESFLLPKRDTYVYHAVLSVTLSQVQQAIKRGGADGMHTWYYDIDNPASSSTGDGEDPLPAPASAPAPLSPPPRADVDAYLQIFAPSTSTPNMLKSLGSNARKGSIRAHVAEHLSARRFLHPSPTLLPPGLSQLPKARGAPPNPYLDFLAWSCRNLEWAGPARHSEFTRSSHHVLPVLMHHFGCVCPSHEALTILKTLCQPDSGTGGKGKSKGKKGDGEGPREKEIWDVGSGNGYWTFMLRRYGCRVRAVDNAQSSWRTTWISDTIDTDGLSFLATADSSSSSHHERAKPDPPSQTQSQPATTTTTTGAPRDPHADALLLLVYPIVGGHSSIAEGSFTRDLVRAFRGDVLAVVGTQNRNGYTGFRGQPMDAWMAAADEGAAWTRIAQVPLPSFAGKDEALFVFRRRPRRGGDGDRGEEGEEEGRRDETAA